MVGMGGMGLWRRWVRQPHSVWLRKAAFQIHLWTGLAIGLYIVVLSVTGSALVYRNEMYRVLSTPRPNFNPSASALTTEELRAAAQRLYPDHEVTRVTDKFSPRDPTIEIWVEKVGVRQERLFDPYTGKDLGERMTRGERFVLWLVSLHDDLLFDREGRFWNGIGSAVLTLLAFTGAFIWWPGITKWRRSLKVKWEATWPRFSWDLHSAFGFWFFAFVALWGVSGIYLSIPDPFTKVNEYFFAEQMELAETPLDVGLRWMTRLHFGRWRSGSLKAVWATVGFVPVLLFVTGAIMWWNRVVRTKLRKNGKTSRTELA